MAKPACTFCEVNEGVLMSTNLADGETVIVCGTCITGYALGLAATVTQGMDAAEAETYAGTLDAIRANDPRAARRPAKPKRQRPAVSAPPQPPLDGLESDAAGSVALPAPCGVCGSLTATGDADKLACDGCGRVIAYADGRPVTDELPATGDMATLSEPLALLDAPESEGT